MTTTVLSIKERVVAANSGECRGNYLGGFSPKLQQIANEIFILTGRGGQAEKVRDWHRNGARLDEKPDFGGEKPDFLLAVFNVNNPNIITEYNDCFMASVSEYRDYYTCGSGWLLALGALEAGATAEQAVKIAIKYDIYTVGDVEKIKF